MEAEEVGLVEEEVVPGVAFSYPVCHIYSFEFEKAGVAPASILNVPTPLLDSSFVDVHNTTNSVCRYSHYTS